MTEAVPYNNTRALPSELHPHSTPPDKIIKLIHGEKENSSYNGLKKSLLCSIYFYIDVTLIDLILLT